MINEEIIKSLGFKDDLELLDKVKKLGVVFIISRFLKGNCTIERNCLDDRWDITVQREYDFSTYSGRVKNKYELKKIIKFLNY